MWKASEAKKIDAHRYFDKKSLANPLKLEKSLQTCGHGFLKPCWAKANYPDRKIVETDFDK